MTYGLMLVNPSGQLVVSADAPGYGFVSRPSPSTSGSYSDNTLNPYGYTVNIGTDALPPIVFIRPTTDRLMQVESIYSLGSGNWGITVFGVGIPGVGPTATPTLAQPDIYVFGPMRAATSQSYGLKMWDKNGNKTYDTSMKPLWIRASYAYSSVSGVYHPAIGQTDSTSMEKDSITIGGATVYGILGTTRGECISYGDDTGEPADYWRYGYYLNGTTLERRRFYSGSYRPSHVYDETNDAVDWERQYQRVIITDLSVY